jgi:hypothetical protein
LRALADDINHTVYGSSHTAVDDLFNTAPTSTPYVEPPSGLWNKNYGPQDAQQTFDFMKWAQDNHVSAEQLYDMAKKWKVQKPEQYGTPSLSQMPGTGTMAPKFVHIEGWPDSPANPNVLDPDLGHKILDFLEQSEHQNVEGLGDHWSTSPSVSSGTFAGGELPIVISADWPGLGEHPGRPHAAWGYGGENEINLAPGAPVRVKRVQIKIPGQGSKWVDLPVEPHMRFASSPPPGALEKLEARIERLARDYHSSLDYLETKIEHLALES